VALLESELFGIEKGAATGVAARKGRFEAANGGTVFLDEIGDMSLALQAKILRVLQERVLERVGGREQIELNIRVVAATNRDLEKEIAAERFRSDLYYRLNVISLTLPPLRERKADIPALVGFFVNRFAQEYSKPVRGVTPDCLDCLLAQEWPGNVRELQNVVERGVILCPGELVRVEDLPAEVQGVSPEASLKDARGRARDKAVAKVEQAAVVSALEQTGWVVKRAAEKLGISRVQLYRIMKKHGIRRPTVPDCD
jgi:two-component system NtrC family response regulator/two-component system response regulator HydG